MKRVTFGLALLGLLALPAMASAYTAAGNTPHVKSSTWGRCYAKSVPLERFGVKGSTKIYSVRADKDELLVTYDWFARSLFLQCNVVSKAGDTGPSVISVNFASDPRGKNADKPAIAFYMGKKLVKQYTYAELHGGDPKLGRFPRILGVTGYRPNGDDYAFDIKTMDGKTHSFDAATGRRLEPKPEPKQ